MQRLIFAVLLLFLCMAGRSAHANAGNETAAATRCEALSQGNFNDILDAPTEISEAKHILTAEEIVAEFAELPADLKPVLLKSLGAIKPMCRVTGYVAPDVGFTLVLPDSNWNGKFLHLGCGGWCGDSSAFVALCALYPDYACIGTDMGHHGEGGLWFRGNVQGQIDFSYRATHVATIAGKALVARYYGREPEKSYFMGCSTGGYQGMVEAQKYPWDFDGIIAGAPDMDEADLAVRGIWLKQHYLDADGKPLFSASDLEFLHEAALKRCDRDDGVNDGIISDPVQCGFDVTELRCRPNQKSACLTVAQVQAAQAIYGAPRTSRGQVLSTRGVLPGSELNWADNFTDVWGESYFRDTGLLSESGKSWSFRDFDFDRDYPRSGSGVIFADTNPDLRKFRAAGGKLISYQGGNDAGEIPGAIVDYYETVERTMGGSVATTDFFRFFIIPGMDHCGGGVGVFAFDYLSYLEAWVERGQAPDRMIGARVPGMDKFGWLFIKYPLSPETPVTFTRPVYPYPAFAKYKGHGDVNSARNFEPQRPRAPKAATGQRLEEKQ